MNKIKQFAIPIAIIALVLLTMYKVFGSEDPIPTREDMKRNSIEQYKEENARMETHNEMTKALCIDEASRIKGDIESARYNLSCLEKNTKTLIDIDSVIAKEYGSGTTTGTASGTPVSSAPERTLRKVFGLGDCRFTNDNHKMNKYGLSWLAYDIACEKDVAFDVSVPDYGYEWVVEKVGYGKSLGDYIIIKDKDSNMRVVYGHTKAIVKEGDIVKKTFTIGTTNISGESTGMHLHLEIWEGYKIVSREVFWSDTYESTDQTKLLVHRKWNFGNKYFFTHYDLGDPNQNDGAPCTGASGKDLCQMEKNGIRTMAITSDIRNEMGIKFGDTVTLVGDEGCAGTYSVQDEMAKRYRQTPGVKRPGTPYYIKGDIPSKEGGACYIIK